MPNTKQTKKRVRQDEERRMRNKPVLRSMRTAMKKVLQAANKEEAEAALPNASKRIDKAAKVSVIHEKTAARYKSRLARRAAEKG